MRTVVVKDYRDFGYLKEHSKKNDGIHRKHDGSSVVEVINVGEYGYLKKIFTTERTLEETGVRYKEI